VVLCLVVLCLLCCVVLYLGDRSVVLSCGMLCCVVLDLGDRCVVLSCVYYVVLCCT